MHSKTDHQECHRRYSMSTNSQFKMDCSKTESMQHPRGALPLGSGIIWWLIGRISAPCPPYPGDEMRRDLHTWPLKTRLDSGVWVHHTGEMTLHEIQWNSQNWEKHGNNVQRWLFNYFSIQGWLRFRSYLHTFCISFNWRNTHMGAIHLWSFVESQYLTWCWTSSFILLISVICTGCNT